MGGVAPERRLPRACWLALAGGGAALAATLPSWGPGAAAEGAVHVVWAVFAAYALLPVGTPVAAGFGILLPTVHTIAAALVAHRFPFHAWQQVSRFEFSYNFKFSIAALKIHKTRKTIDLMAKKLDVLFEHFCGCTSLASSRARPWPSVSQLTRLMRCCIINFMASLATLLTLDT